MNPSGWATVSLMPSDNIEGFRPEVLKLLKELNSPVYRWPGGNFVSGYNWKDGIGDPDRRPPRKNPAWLGVEHNDVGIDEFMRFCELLDTEPYITVNSGQGARRQAAEEVEYVNGAASTRHGQVARRERHGSSPGPSSGGRSATRCTAVGSSDTCRSRITRRNTTVSPRHMRAEDPSIKIDRRRRRGPLERRHAAGMRGRHGPHQRAFLLSARGPGLTRPRCPDPARGPANRRGPPQIPPDDPRAQRARTFRIALDEWNYWYGPHVFGELGHALFSQGRAWALRPACTKYFRQSDIIFMANYAQTVNVIGSIKTSKTAAAFETTGLVLKLYRAHFGTIPVKVDGTPAPLDVAAWKDRRKKP